MVAPFLYQGILADWPAQLKLNLLQEKSYLFFTSAIIFVSNNKIYFTTVYFIYLQCVELSLSLGLIECR
jgi:hypothetical protein